MNEPALMKKGKTLPIIGPYLIKTDPMVEGFQIDMGSPSPESDIRVTLILDVAHHVSLGL